MVKEKLDRIISYFQRNRGVGHTSAMLHGAASRGCNIVAHDKYFGRELKQVALQFGSIANIVTLDNLESLRGSTLPLVFDNYALESLLTESRMEILKLERENVRLITISNDKIANLENEVTDLESDKVDLFAKVMNLEEKVRELENDLEDMADRLYIESEDYKSMCE